MKIIIHSIQVLLILILFNSCGSVDTQEGEYSSKTYNGKGIINCNLSNKNNATNDCNGYTCLKKLDTLVSLSNDTVLNIVHISTNEKKVCLISGSSLIIR